ncbi:amidohydrolase family protein [Lachnospiraceae bacterium ZAX-1]
MEYDYIIENAMVVDPGQGIHGVQTVGVGNGRIVAVSSEDSAKYLIDASGHYLFPGLIENHTHLFYGAGDIGIPADLFLLPNGITSAIDYGSASYANFPLFYQTVIVPSQCSIRAYLNVFPTGIMANHIFENTQPRDFNETAIEQVYKRYSNVLLGLKVRIEKGRGEDENLTSLKKTIEMSEKLGCPVAVHVKNPPAPLCDIAKLLRKGDVWAHIYQLQGESFLDENGAVKEALWEAKRRGILFDGASGRTGFTIKDIRTMLEQGFAPDLMGTDSVLQNFYKRPMFSLIYVMSLFLNLGMELDEVVRLCTVRPATIMGLDQEIGTLTPGARADLSIFKLQEAPTRFSDCYGDSFMGDRILIPKFTLKDGLVKYRSIDF